MRAQDTHCIVGDASLAGSAVDLMEAVFFRSFDAVNGARFARRLRRPGSGPVCFFGGNRVSVATAPPGRLPRWCDLTRYAFSMRSLRTEHLPFSGPIRGERLSGSHPSSRARGREPLARTRSGSGKHQEIAILSRSSPLIDAKIARVKNLIG